MTYIDCLQSTGICFLLSKNKPGQERVAVCVVVVTTVVNAFAVVVDCVNISAAVCNVTAVVDAFAVVVDCVNISAVVGNVTAVVDAFDVVVYVLMLFLLLFTC